MMTFPKNSTSQDIFGPAMRVETFEEAEDYLDAIIRYIQSHSKMSRIEAKRIARQSLGYWVGYFDHKTRERVETLFQCEHPLFGTIAGKGAPTPEEALRIGLEMGRKYKEEKKMAVPSDPLDIFWNVAISEQEL